MSAMAHYLGTPPCAPRHLITCSDLPSGCCVQRLQLPAINRSHALVRRILHCDQPRRRPRGFTSDDPDSGTGREIRDRSARRLCFRLRCGMAREWEQLFTSWQVPDKKSGPARIATSPENPKHAEALARMRLQRPGGTIPLHSCRQLHRTRPMSSTWDALNLANRRRCQKGSMLIQSQADGPLLVSCMCRRAQHVDGAERSGGGQLTRWVLRAGPAHCVGVAVVVPLNSPTPDRRICREAIGGIHCASSSTRPNRLHRSVHANVMHARDPRQHVPRPGAVEPCHAHALGRAKWSRDQAGDRQNRDEECGERVAPWTTHRTTSTPRCRRTPCEDEGDTPATLASSLG
ncbi:hypothetical protein BU16DRAFT_280786 [Lophium mytilinum]|uniref:Uncharacterized protein n=1 Tax=Lophium mytilinum TaxID=390894 RepID=A0A6A6R5G5_9PEZI|nr:hypothetical protein BU16DRAFT_280786 [Lophium mytilinum]